MKEDEKRRDWIGISTGGLGNNGKGGDHPNYYIIEIGQNTVESP